MKNFLKKLWTEISNHNRYQVISGILCVVLLVWFYGCEVKCKSILHPDTQITRTELQAELDSIYAGAKERINVLDKQEELRQYLLDTAITTGTTGTINPWALFGTISTILFGGAATDNVRKRIAIKKLSATPPV
jgi:hypothetical protein